MTPPSPGDRAEGAGQRSRRLLLLGAVVAVSFMLRSPISSVSSALSDIAGDLDLNAVASGLATGLPLICFGVFAFTTPLLTRRYGLAVTLWVALGLLVVGIVVRSIVTVPTFFLGITLIGLGIAIGNVVIPAIIRVAFRDRLALLMSLYSLGLQVGATGGALATAPLMTGLGWSWPWALGVWTVPAGAALVLWTWVLLRDRRQQAVLRRSTGGPLTTSIAELARRPRVRALSAFMGVQSMTFYSLLTWLPQILQDEGFTPARAGLLLGVLTILGLPGSFLGPIIAEARWGAGAIVALVVLNVTGVVLLLFGAPAAVLGVIACGLCQGAWLSIALTFIAHQRVPEDVPGVSALAQGSGYLVAATGPLLLGGLYAATGGWTVPVLAIVAAFAVVAVLGVGLARSHT